MLWRHGDVLIATIEAIPDGAQRRTSPVLVYGEATGQAHRVEDAATAEIWDLDGDLYLRVTDVAYLVHEAHQPLTLPAGTYRVWQQREYTPQAIRRIVD